MVLVHRRTKAKVTHDFSWLVPIFSVRKCVLFNSDTEENNFSSVNSTVLKKNIGM